MKSRYLVCEGRELHFTDWGAEHREAVIAWHGLARTGRDMDELAGHLSARYRVICPDTIGRGLSQWSPHPEREYCLDFYGRLALSLLEQLGIRNCHWVGTSMGGAIGIRLAAGALKGRMRRLVLNDMGPKIADAAVERIKAYAGKPPQFDRLSELEQHFRTIYKPYGWLSDDQWRRLTETSTRRRFVTSVLETLIVQRHFWLANSTSSSESPSAGQAGAIESSVSLFVAIQLASVFCSV